MTTERLRQRVEAWIDQVESEQPHGNDDEAYEQRREIARSLRLTIDPPMFDFPPDAMPDSDADFGGAS